MESERDPATEDLSRDLHHTGSATGVGRDVGPYHTIAELGRGSMGIVYLAEQKTPVQRRVALKLIGTGVDPEDALARFEAERQLLARMSHANIARIYEAGTAADGTLYFSMEYIEGEPIDRYCDGRRLTVRERLDLFLQVCDAVEHAHQRGVIHRDIKPTNVLVSAPDDRPLAKLIDFGLAKALDQVATARVLYTSFGRIVGTPVYMSPEQARSSRHSLDSRTDVYSLGVLLYEIVVGENPFEWGEVAAFDYAVILHRICEEEPPLPSRRWTRLSLERRSHHAARRRTTPADLGRELRDELDWIVGKAIEKDRGRRYRHASELADDLRRHLRGEIPVARPPSTLYRMRKYLRKNRGPVAAATAILLAFAVGLVLSLWQWRRAEWESDRAQEAAARLAGEKSAAEQASRVAEAAKTEAQAQSYEARWNLYVANLVAARLGIEGDRTAEAKARLAACPEEYRGFEWGHLRLLVDASIAVLRDEDAGPVTALAVSDNGELAAAGHADGKIRLWSLPERRLLRVLTGHTGQVSSVAIRGTSLASGSQDGSVRVWSSADGEPLGRIDVEGDTEALSWTEDGQALACAVRPRTKTERGWDWMPGTLRVQIRGLQNGQVVTQVPDPAYPHTGVEAVGFSADASYVALLMEYGALEIFRRKASHEGFERVEHMPSEDLLLRDDRAQVASLRDKCGLAVHARDGRVVCLELSPTGGPKVEARVGLDVKDRRGFESFAVTGEEIVFGRTAGCVEVERCRIWPWTPEEWRSCAAENRRIAFKGHEGEVFAVCTDPRGGLIVSGGADGSVRLWSPVVHPARLSLRCPYVSSGEDPSNSAFCEVLGSTEQVATGRVSVLTDDLPRVRYADVRTWDKLSGDILTVYFDSSSDANLPNTSHGPLDRLSVERALRTLPQRSGLVYLADPDEERRLVRSVAGVFPAYALRLRGSTWVAFTALQPSPSPSVMLGLVDAGNRRLVWSNTVEQPDDDTNRKFSGRPDFDPSEVRREVRSFARSFFREVRAPLKLSPDAKRLLALNCFDWRLVDIETGTALWMRPNVVMTLSRAGLSFRAITAAFSPDSQLLAVGDSRGALRIFETQSGREVRVLWGATEELGAAVFDPGGTRLAAVDIQGSLFVWEPSRGDLLLTLANAAAPGDGEAYFSPDGRRLVLGGASPAILESQFNPEARSRRAEIVRCYNRVFPLLDKLFCELPHRHAVMDRLRADVTLPDDVRRDAITLAERYVRVLGPFRPGQTPQTSQDNARLLFDAGWRVEAIRLLEDATRAADGLRTFQLQLEEYRRALEPDLVSYASIDAAVLLSDRSESFDAFRGVATGADAVSRLLYLEGRLLQRSGKSREALDRYRAAFDADRRGIDILERLAECAMACLEPIEAERIVVETFRSAEVFEMARPLRPSGRPVGSAAADQVLVLHASPFLYSHVDTSIDGLESQLEIPVLRSRWQVREAGGSFDAPALNLDVAPPLGPNRLALPAGILEPSKSYFWRIAYGGKALDSDGREVAWVESAFSFEVPLSTSGIPSSATESFDLQANFNRDVVADHGDSENDAFGLRGLLSLNGFAVPGSVREVYGLPSDRRVGVHLLADYAGKNAIEFTPDGRKPLRFTFPRGRFGAVRLLFSAVDDGADLVLRCDYAGEWRQLPLSLRYDEFDPTTPRDLRGHWKDRAPWVADESILVRHRACSHLLQPDGSFLPRPVWFFDAIVSTRQDRELSAIEVEAQYFARPESRVYLFAAAGMRIAE